MAKDPSASMTFFDHLDELRPHLLRASVAIVVFLVGAFLAKGFIIDTILFGPQSETFPMNRLFDKLADAWGMDFLRLNKANFTMVNTSMAGQFNLHIKISVITAIVLAVPYILYEIWRFVKPALTSSELKGSRMFVLYVSLCFFTGLLFGYLVISPLTINFLTQYTVSQTVTNMIDVNSYLSTVVNVSVACAAVFQLPLLVYFLARMGVITSAFMRKYRRHAIVILALFAAVITPPDAFSLVLVALPMYGLYELGIRIAANVEKKRAALTET